MTQNTSHLSQQAARSGVANSAHAATHPNHSAELPWANTAYSIKRHGTSITQCDTEPVHTPGCIQSHGVLLVLRLADLTVVQVSENSLQFLGRSPAQLLGCSIEQVVGASNMQFLERLLDNPALERNTVYAFTLPAAAHVAALDVCVHTIGGVVVLELEATGRVGSHTDGDFFAMVKSAISRMQTAQGLREFCQRTAAEVRSITGLDRVMVYRFHADHHGEVFAESKRDDLAPWLGLHYPEADIPQQARDIYKRIWIRPVPNAAGPLIEMVPLANPDTGQPLDMTHCVLRGASVMYTEYLANMGVAASLTMPILIDGVLWGMIACHHMTPTHFPHQVRAACELLAQTASLQLKSTEHIEQLAYRLQVESVHQELVIKAAKEGDLLALSDSQPSLLDAMVADGAALYHMDRWWCAGRTPSHTQLDALAEWVNRHPEFNSITRPVFATDALANEYAAGAEIADVASGIIAVRISRLRTDLIMWFRPEIIQTVHWAGNPHDKPLVPGPHGMRLTPRRSFELFVETVHQRALPWSAIEVDSALRLRLLVMELVISRAERLAELNIDLTNSNEELDSFAYVASHDLKEPLRGIHRYAHQMLDSAQTLGHDNRQRVESLVRLTQRMDSLLDSLLHFSRVGRTNLHFEMTNLNTVVAEALEMVGASRFDTPGTMTIPRQLPTMACDAMRVREVYSNLLTNALKYNLQANPKIELGYIAADQAGAPSNAPPETAGHPILYVRDNGIGIAPQHFEQIFRMFKRLHGRDEFGGGVGAGLTVVKKVVKRHGGCIWLESQVGAGSTFYFTLPCTQGGTP
jgi:two-component system, chemotaxis family, sensor kinase Cph1